MECSDDTIYIVEEEFLNEDKDKKQETIENILLSIIIRDENNV
jgi:hypothetical protein